MQPVLRGGNDKPGDPRRRVVADGVCGSGKPFTHCVAATESTSERHILGRLGGMTRIIVLNLTQLDGIYLFVPGVRWVDF